MCGQGSWIGPPHRCGAEAVVDVVCYNPKLCLPLHHRVIHAHMAILLLYCSSRMPAQGAQRGAPSVGSGARCWTKKNLHQVTAVVLPCTCMSSNHFRWIFPALTLNQSYI